MSDFIHYKAVDMDNVEEEEEEEEDEKNQGSDSFIDDETFFTDQITPNYRLVKNSIENFEESSYSSCINVSVGYEEAMDLSDSKFSFKNNIICIQRDICLSR